MIEKNREHPYPYYGSLLQHHDLQNPKILNYSVLLNDYDSLAWEPINPGRLAIWQIDWQRFRSVELERWDRHNINQALHISVNEFHDFIPLI
ncbi:hypothetical protein RintRC_1415 [Richelia intracellularis]|nr:hypothetical protein RintRC_1415 [Richelia intracellularis]